MRDNQWFIVARLCSKDLVFSFCSVRFEFFLTPIYIFIDALCNLGSVRKRGRFEAYVWCQHRRSNVVELWMEIPDRTWEKDPDGIALVDFINSILLKNIICFLL
jgi:hypothetical protein